jgi:hypothetical protein
MIIDNRQVRTNYMNTHHVIIFIKQTEISNNEDIATLIPEDVSVVKCS